MFGPLGPPHNVLHIWSRSTPPRAPVPRHRAVQNHSDKPAWRLEDRCARHGGSGAAPDGRGSGQCGGRGALQGRPRHRTGAGFSGSGCGRRGDVDGEVMPKAVSRRSASGRTSRTPSWRRPFPMPCQSRASWSAGHWSVSGACQGKAQGHPPLAREGAWLAPPQADAQGHQPAA